MNSKDPRVIRTKNAFKNALKEMMLKNMDYYSVTVKELCEKAGFSRRTFYLHFESVDEVLLLLQQDIAESLYTAFKSRENSIDTKTIVRACFTVIESDAFVRKLIITPRSMQLTEVVRSILISYIKSNYKSSNKNDEFFQHMSSILYQDTMITIYKEWSKQKNNISLDEIIEYTCKYIDYGQSYLKKGI